MAPQYTRPRRRRSTSELLRFPLTLLGLIGICALFYVFIALPPEPQAAPVVLPTPAPIAETANVRGDPTAPVRFVLYCDVTSPDCGKFYDQLLPDLQKTYVDTNKVALVFVHTPRGSDARGVQPRRSSSALICAQEQGKFWEMFELMMANHEEWRSRRSDDVVPVLEAYAQQLGLDLEAFKSCSDPANAETQAKIDEDIADAKKVNANQIYAFRINQRPSFGGFRDFNFVKDLIEEELK